MYNLWYGKCSNRFCFERIKQSIKFSELSPLSFQRPPNLAKNLVKGWRAAFFLVVSMPLEMAMIACYIIQGQVRFDANGTVFQDRIRLLQYRRHSNSEEYYNRLLDYCKYRTM